jgi:hypothetical protein
VTSVLLLLGKAPSVVPPAGLLIVGDDTGPAAWALAQSRPFVHFRCDGRAVLRCPGRPDRDQDWTGMATRMRAVPETEAWALAEAEAIAYYLDVRRILHEDIVACVATDARGAARTAIEECRRRRIWTEDR